MALTDVTVRQTKAKAQPFKIADGEGLYLLVRPDGAKYWRLAYRYNGKQKTLAIGVYPEVSLSEARKRRANARELLAQEPPIDPGAKKQADKRARRIMADNTFERIALSWHATKGEQWSDTHAKAVLARLKLDLLPALGLRPIAEIDAPELLAVLRQIEGRDALEVAAKARMIAGQVFRYAIAIGAAKSDIAKDLRGALKTREVEHYAKLTDDDLPEFLRKLAAYDGNALTRHAIKLLALTWVRTGELRGARWTEFNIEKREWRIPAERMKMGVEHVVPLSDQALAVIEEIRKLSGHREHVFPNEHKPTKCMSENTVLYALYRMGYRGKATGHGFRGTASTIMNEQQRDERRLWSSDAIERQLAHGEKDKVRAAYNAAQYLPERRRMMQAWADYLDARASGATVTPIRQAA